MSGLFPLLGAIRGRGVRHDARALLTGMALLVAAFTVYAAVFVQQVTVRTVTAAAAAEGTSPAVDLVVGNQTQLEPAPASLVGRLREMPGVDSVAGRLATGGGFKNEYFTVIADPGQGPLAIASAAEGRYPRTDKEIALTPRSATEMNVRVGQSVSVEKEGSAARVYRVVGIARDPDNARFTGYTTLAGAQRLATEPGIWQIDVHFADGATPEQVAAATALAQGQPVLTGDEVRAAEIAEKVADYQPLFAVVGAFIAVAVAAAALVATSTFRIVFAQRMRRLALLRAIGAGRAALFRALVWEGARTGGVAGVVGVVAAAVVAEVGLAVVRQSYPAVGGPILPVLPAIGTVLAVMAIAVVAATAPALSATRVSPVEAVREAAVTSGRGGVSRARLGTGLVLLALAVALVFWVVSQFPKAGEAVPPDSMIGPLLGVVASGTFAYFALVALGPLLIRPLLAVVGRPLRVFGVVGKLAVEGVGGAARRAAAVSVVVALGATLVVGAVIGGDSVQTAAARSLAVSAPADFAVSSETVLPVASTGRLAGDPQLRDVVAFRTTQSITVGTLENFPAPVGDLGARAPGLLRDVELREGSIASLGPGQVVVDDQVAREQGLRVGSRLTLTRAPKTLTVTVAAIWADDAPLYVRVLADPADLDRLGVGPRPTDLIADAAAPGNEARVAAEQAIHDATGLEVRVLAKERDAVEQGVRTLFAALLGMLGLTVLISVVGVAATATLTVVERVREAGVLRALGVGRGGLRGMLLLEAGLYGLLGAVIGVALGVPYGWLALRTLSPTAPLTLPLAGIGAVVLALCALTAAAGVTAARRAARISPVAALATE